MKNTTGMFSTIKTGLMTLSASSLLLASSAFAEQQQAPSAQSQNQAAAQTEQAQSGGTITVNQKPAQIVVEKPPAQVTINQPKPKVTITTQDPEVSVEQGEPRVSVQQPKPEVSVEQAKPEINVQDADPQVRVQQAQPQIDIQEEDPEVSVEQQRSQVQEREMSAAETQERQTQEREMSAAETQEAKRLSMDASRVPMQAAEADTSGETNDSVVSRVAEPETSAQLAEPALAMPEAETANTDSAQLAERDHRDAEQQVSAETSGASSSLYEMPIEELRSASVTDPAGQPVGEVEDVMVKLDNSEAGLIIFTQNESTPGGAYKFAPVEELTLVNNSLVWEKGAEAENISESQDFDVREYQSAPSTARTLSELVEGQSEEGLSSR